MLKKDMINIRAHTFGRFAHPWFQKRRLEIVRFFSVISVVLDMRIERLLRNLKIIIELIRVHVVLKLVPKLSLFLVYLCY